MREVVHRAVAVVALALGLVTGAGEVRAASFPLTWRWSNPTPHGNNIIDVAVTNQFWIQVAERGQVYTSGDLFEWTPRDSHTTNALRAVTFFRDQILISAEAGTLVVGPSASELTVIDLNSPDWLEGIAASDQLAVAVGDNGAIYTSPDAAVWQRQSVPFKAWLRSVAFGTPGGTGMFVAVGEAGFVATSSDGAHWQTRNPLTAHDLNRVSWFNGEFWALGDSGAAFLSTSGKSWSPVATGATNVLNAFAGLDAMRLAAGDAEVRLRLARTVWVDQLDTANPAPAPLATYLCAASDTNAFLLCGRTGAMAQGIVTNGAASWLSLSDSVRNWLWDIKRFPGTYLAVGDRATVLSSLDGISWDQELPADSATNSIFLGIGGRTNLAVVVGNAGTIMTSADELQSIVSTNTDGTLSTNLVSTLGVLWKAVEPRPATEDLQGVVAFGDQFVVSGGSGLILTSLDTKTWTRRSTPTTAFLSSLESYPGGLVAVGHTGTILTSQDGATWVPRTSSTTNWIYRVRFAGNQLVAVGQGGLVLTSTNGTNWVVQKTGSTGWLTDVQWIDGTYFAVGTQGTVLTSPNAVTWTDRGTITGKSLFGAAQQSGMLVVVGVEGVILRTQVVPFNTPVSVLAYPHRPEDNVFLFSGQIGQRFTLDRSVDLSAWTNGPVLEIDNSGTLLHLDSGTNSVPRQFYRTSLRP